MCRDGLERVQVPDTGTLADMWAAVSKALDIPQERMALSKDPKLVGRLACMPCKELKVIWHAVAMRFAGAKLQRIACFSQRTTERTCRVNCQPRAALLSASFNAHTALERYRARRYLQLRQRLPLCVL
jgi:hypothetical protein